MATYEEKDLLSVLGKQYADYQRRVPFFSAGGKERLGVDMA
jgi:protein-S-isoprenylcysteine O-methyltransferase Ste14